LNWPRKKKKPRTKSAPIGNRDLRPLGGGKKRKKKKGDCTFFGTYKTPRGCYF